MKKLKILVSLVCMLGVFSFTNAIAMEKTEKNILEINEQKEEFGSEASPVKVEVEKFNNEPGKGEIKIIFDLSADEVSGSERWLEYIEHYEDYLNKLSRDSDLGEGIQKDLYESVLNFGDNNKYEKIDENVFYNDNFSKNLWIFFRAFAKYGMFEREQDEKLAEKNGYGLYYHDIALYFSAFVNMTRDTDFHPRIEFDDPKGYKNNENFNGRIIIKFSNYDDNLKEKFDNFQVNMSKMREYFKFRPFVAARALFYIIMEKYMKEQQIAAKAIGKEYSIDLNNNIDPNNYILNNKDKGENITSSAEEKGIKYDGTVEDFKKYFEIAYNEINKYRFFVKNSYGEKYGMLGTLFSPENIDYIRFSEDDSKIMFKFKERSDLEIETKPSGFRKYIIDANLFKLLNFEKYVKTWTTKPLNSYANIIREIVFMYKERMPKKQEFPENFGKEKVDMKEKEVEKEEIKEEIKEEEKDIYSFRITNPFEYLNYFFKGIEENVAEQVLNKGIKIDGTEEDFNRFYEVVYKELLTIPKYKENKYLKYFFGPENIRYIIKKNNKNFEDEDKEDIDDFGKKINFKVKNMEEFVKNKCYRFNKAFVDLSIQVVLLYENIGMEMEFILKSKENKEKNKLKEENNELKKENNELKAKNKKLEEELEKLKEEIEKLKEEIEKLKK